MPEEIVARILRLPGYGVYAWEADEATNTLILAIRQTAREPFYVCRGCGIGVRYVHSWTERRLRDLPWGTWQVWLRVEVHRVHCPRCGPDGTSAGLAPKKAGVTEIGRPGTSEKLSER